MVALAQGVGIHTVDCQSFVLESDILYQAYLQEKSLDRIAGKLAKLHEFCLVHTMSNQSAEMAVRGE